MTQTYLVKVFTEGQNPQSFDWREWRECEPGDKLLPRLALNRWIKDRGGLSAGEALTVTVYYAPKTVERDKKGEPIGCVAEVFAVSNPVQEFAR